MCPPATDPPGTGGSARLDLAPAALGAARLGVYGGSFDPAHAGHLWVAQQAREKFALEHVIFVPARRPPHKPGHRLAPDADRLALLSLLLTGCAWASLWPGELRREGPSYTVDSLGELRAGLPSDCELFLLLGSDNLAGLPTWERVEQLLGLAQPIVLHRREASLDVAGLDGLDAEQKARIERGFVQVEPMDASATSIRAALAAGADPGSAFPHRLREYVAARGLYGASKSN